MERDFEVSHWFVFPKRLSEARLERKTEGRERRRRRGATIGFLAEGDQD